MPPRSLTACISLPPEGAAPPAAWQSQFRGRNLRIRGWGLVRTKRYGRFTKGNP